MEKASVRALGQDHNENRNEDDELTGPRDAQMKGRGADSAVTIDAEEGGDCVTAPTGSSLTPSDGGQEAEVIDADPGCSNSRLPACSPSHAAAEEGEAGSERSNVCLPVHLSSNPAYSSEAELGGERHERHQLYLCSPAIDGDDEPCRHPPAARSACASVGSSTEVSEANDLPPQSKQNCQSRLISDEEADLQGRGHCPDRSTREYCSECGNRQNELTLQRCPLAATTREPGENARGVDDDSPDDPNDVRKEDPSRDQPGIAHKNFRAKDPSGLEPQQQQQCSVGPHAGATIEGRRDEITTSALGDQLQEPALVNHPLHTQAISPATATTGNPDISTAARADAGNGSGPAAVTGRRPAAAADVSGSNLADGPAARALAGDSKGVSRSSSSASDSSTSASASTGDEEEEEEGEDDEEMDPRVKTNLEILNQSSADINKLENELTEARRSFTATMHANASSLEQKKGRLKKVIHRARPYFELTDKAKEAKAEAERSTKQYVTAKSQCNLAKEMISNAEELLSNQGDICKLDMSFQEYINQATEKVMVCETEKARCASELAKRNEVYDSVNKELGRLQKKFNKSIEKARPYFEERALWELKLKQNKQNIDDLQQAIRARKLQYQEALNTLQAVSMEIHESRAARRFRKKMLRYPREPGVGAEMDSPGSSWTDLHLEKAMCGSVCSSIEDDDFEEEDEDDDTWDDSSNASDGAVIAHAVSSGRSIRQSHTRQSSYGSAQIKLPRAVRRSASGTGGDYPSGPERAAAVRRCASGTDSDFHSSRAAARLSARSSASGTESDLSSSAPDSPLRSHPDSPVAGTPPPLGPRRVDLALFSDVGVTPGSSAGSSFGCSSVQLPGEADPRERGTGRGASPLRQAGHAVGWGETAGGASERLKEEAGGTGGRPLVSCRLAGDGSSEEEVTADKPPSLQSTGPALKASPDPPRGPAAFVAGFMAAADKSAAIHLSLCTGEPPVFPRLSPQSPESAGQSACAGGRPRAGSASSLLAQPAAAGVGETRRSDTPPQLRKLKGPMMLNPADLHMPRLPF